MDIQKFSGLQFLKNFLFCIGYGALFMALYLFLHKSAMVSTCPSDKTLLQWDAGMYQSIVQNGYEYNPPNHANSGWYILFPWIWQLSHTGPLGISIINYVLYAIGFALLAGLYNIGTRDKLIWLTIPFSFIMLTPYAEATFFVCGSLALAGIARNNRLLTWLGLFTLALTRANALFLFPALLAAELLAHPREKWYRCLVPYLVNYALPLTAGTAFFVIYQYEKVKIWFVYFTYQQEFQGHKFGWPVWPLSNFNGPRTMWLNAGAIFVCFLSLILLIRQAILWLARNRVEVDKVFVVSLGFFVVTLYKTLFYNPIWGSGSTLIFGMARYVLATPFFCVFLQRLSTGDRPYKWPHYVFVAIAANLVWLACGSYAHLQYTLYFNFCTLLIFCYLALANRRIEWPAYALIAIGLVMQVITYQHFLEGLFTD